MQTDNASKLKFKTIAVATDLSDSSSTALRYARAMARMCSSIPACEGRP